MSDTSPAHLVLHISTALIMNDKGQVLLVRKAGTTAFMQAGGKIGSDETPIDALKRELKEELDFTLRSEEAHYISLFTAPAAHEPNFSVAAHCYYIASSEAFKAHAEIAEVIWANPFEADHIALAPLTRDCILPEACKILKANPPHIL